MGRTQVVATITISLLALSFWVGSGAEEYVAWDSGDTNVDDDFERQQIDLRDAENFQYTYYDEETDSIKPNQSEFENESSYGAFQDIPQAEFDPGIDNIDSYSIEVEYPDGVPNGEEGSMEYAQGIDFTYLENGTNIVANQRDDGSFRVTFPVEDEDDPLWNASITEIRTSNEAAQRQGFIDNLQGLASVSSGYPFVQEVIIGAILVVISYLIVRLFPTVG